MTKSTLDNGDVYYHVETPRSAPKHKLFTHSRFTSFEISKKFCSFKLSKFKFLQLYRFASSLDKFLLVIGIITVGINGALLPLMAIVFGNVLTGFSHIPVKMDTVNQAALDYLLIAIGMFFTDYLSYLTFYYTAERQMKALRGEAFKRMLYLDITWYDKNDALRLTSRLTGDTIKIKDGMGQKLGDSIRFIVQFGVGFLVGFYRGWDITLVMACVVPFMALSLGWLVQTLRVKSGWAQKVYAEAGSVAEETLGSIRTVASLNGEQKAIKKFEDKVLRAQRKNIALHKMSSMMISLFVGSVWVMYAVGLWYGGWKVSKGDTTPGDVFAVFFGVMMGTSALAQISPNLTAVSTAVGAAEELFAILDTTSAIDAEKEDNGIIPEGCEGRIEAKNVNFTYPSRPDAQILRDYNLTIESGQMVAFVGASGGGKSTLTALIERFYDPISGSIYLDGRDIKTLNVRWLRSQISLVSQEPILFATTIFDNITIGSDNVTLNEAMEACKQSNAHNFIMSLPDQYNTFVGEKGVSLSGGQKQRIAIARAIVRKPRILILDEATSALDNASEKVVQMALNDLIATTNMTTLIIAHRLSTIRCANKIVVLNEGCIVESGTHDQLLQIEHGVYQKMYHLQKLRLLGEEQEVLNSEAGTIGKLPRTLSGVSANTDILKDGIEKNIVNKTPFTLMDIARLCTFETKYFTLGTIGACVGGFAMPISALLVTGMMTSLKNKYTLYQDTGDEVNLSKLSQEVKVYSMFYLIGAIVVIIFKFMQTYCFKLIGEYTSTRLRLTNFESLCRQNIGFFDEKKNAVGALTAGLAINATKVAMLCGESQARVFQAIFTLVAVLVISFSFGSWLLSLIMLVVLPLLLFGHTIRMKRTISGSLLSDDLSLASAHASEALSNIRTVASLGIERKCCQIFNTLLEDPLRKGSIEAHINGASLGFSSSIMMATYSLVFWVGAKMVDNGSITFTEMMRTLMSFMMSIQVVSGASTFMNDLPKALAAGSTIFSIRDRTAPIDSFSPDGLQLAKVKGQLELKDISFRYPNRPEISVLRHCSVTIKPGQTVAFCGLSGSGKSTIVSIIERFYDPVMGEVLLDGHNIKSLNLQWLRNQIGLVGQEPTLFNGSIADNIAYGLAKQPCQQEIEEAAKMANAHDFIRQFPDGYNTQVGMKGEQLSGGQKQRIAIARAVLRNPSILVLDEATSALDSESEKVVQEALDKVVAQTHRTTIVIAHRLFTIRHADMICVMSSGRIAEKGTHHELMQINGIYTSLVMSSSM
ncbi:multidrug resistance protein abc superfamily [Plasmopara halstedii]|uniref:Multidrug resistance protein abc superfamily n=1 Tax=Plasmopara halstedii TaxID=4781 RepID=A0A0P1B7C5_PLAHL|nr:multidrug resistance protein abc superfamily [Plasmopara halstedii]CEG50437.1 multidrug resistance protein abc superfamily [Plasmopara halstedii]|eukprot:XP_024586806.1 multidrug resistance protein abc superfamily [Plasmopara halstedii]